MNLKYLIVFSVLISCTLNHKQEPADERLLPGKYANLETNHELFMEATGNKSKSWIQLTYRNDSISGVFFGVEKLADGNQVYYRSAMEKLALDGDNIQFVLSKYCFSNKPFTDTTETNIVCADPDLKLPAILLFPQIFSGRKSPQSLELRRVSPLYDSRFDKFTFRRY